MATYLQSGVNLEAASQWVKKLKTLSSNIGGFAGTYPLGVDDLVASTDGVGTKLKLAISLNCHKTIGIDLVAMNVNDILTCGAKPLFFLDYIATAKLDLLQMEQIITGILQGCEEAGCALIGGETAQMSDFYRPGEYDMAGFAVGLVKRKERLDPSSVQKGDSLIGIASSGPHSNGYSLIRKIVGENLNIHIDDSGKTLGEILLTPTRIYVKKVQKLLVEFPIKAMAHITGGSFRKNIPRMLPPTLSANLFQGAWPVPFIFRYLQEKGAVESQEMYRTFNMGIGYVLAMEPEAAESLLKEEKDSFLIGEIIEGTDLVWT